MLGDAVVAVFLLLAAGIGACLLLALLGASAFLALAAWRMVRDFWRPGGAAR